jgi:hypothetical protein
MSPHEDPLNDLSALEAALASLVPRADWLDRDRLMYLAGQASVAHTPAAGHPAAVSPRRWGWPAAFAAMTAVAASLLVALVMQPGPQVAERVVFVPHDSVAVKPAQEDRKPATTPRGAEPVQPALEDENRVSPPWPWGSFVLARSDWQHDRLVRMGFSRADYARLLGTPSERGIEAVKEPAAANGKTSATAPAPVSHRELLESLLKETQS